MSMLRNLGLFAFAALVAFGGLVKQAWAASAETAATDTYDGLAITSAIDGTVVAAAFSTLLIIAVGITMARVGFAAVRSGVMRFFGRA